MVPGTEVAEEALGCIPDWEGWETPLLLSQVGVREQGAGARVEWPSVEGVKADS